MSAATFDTLAAVKQLKAAGFADEQAEAVVSAVRQAHTVDLSDLVTKTELRAELATNRAEILKWMFGQTLVILGAVAALLKLGAHP